MPRADSELCGSPLQSAWWQSHLNLLCGFLSDGRSRKLALNQMARPRGLGPGSGFQETIPARPELRGIVSTNAVYRPQPSHFSATATTRPFGNHFRVTNDNTRGRFPNHWELIVRRSKRLKPNNRQPMRVEPISVDNDVAEQMLRSRIRCGRITASGGRLNAR